MTAESSDRPEVTQLDFSEASGTSYNRAYSEGMVIRPRGRFTYLVRLTDSDDSHIAKIAVDNGFVGTCGCKGYKHHDTPCAHLWALYVAQKREVIDIPNVREALSSPEKCPRCGMSVDQ